MAHFKHLIPLIDLTTLNPDESEERIVKFCKNATTPFGRVASVCVAPPFVNLARQTLDELHANSIGVTTVFCPEEIHEEDILKRVDTALDQGANSIEVIYPVAAHREGNETFCAQYISGIRALCLTKGAELKVILECSQLDDEASLRRACQIAIQHGARFLKSSSHRYKHESSEWLSIMIDEIKKSGKTVGIKLSGGCLDIEQTLYYLQHISEQLPQEKLSAEYVRIGCSSLLTEILNSLGAIAADDAF
ncbi:MAG: hypothetical protein Q4B71_00110 [Cardiobacteriaceae bacterium]|nr:hypothetical protein [Cardiobacteriaceae bacterium]